MSTESQSDAAGSKKPYVKPQVTRVLLKPEEAVLGACKSATGRGPGQTNCRTPGKCKVLGS